MTRYDDWRVKLNEYFALTDGGQPPEEVNCAVYVSGAVKAMTGEDPLEEVGRGTVVEQLRRIRALGYSDIEDYLSHRHEEREPNFEQVGDIATVDSSWGDAGLGVVIGSEIKVLREDGSVGVIPIENARKVYVV